MFVGEFMDSDKKHSNALIKSTRMIAGLTDDLHVCADLIDGHKFVKRAILSLTFFTRPADHLVRSFSFIGLVPFAYIDMIYMWG